MRDFTPIVEHLNATRAALVAAAEKIPEGRWKESPRPGSWSAGEVMAHLAMVEGRVIEGATKVVGAAPIPVPLWKRAHLPVWLGEWRGFRVKSPIALDPALVVERQPMLARMGQVREGTLGFIEANRGRDLGVYRFPHPFFGSLNVYDWMRMIAYHDARHTQQIREIIEIFHS
ncbi:MAG TPA: DinB family protein [Candidatus Acidoferrales bacterium]|jgi:hypothetical protein|nr:DinB family protein [Candidatus Acidoferrales bacterium]